jgi:hypothetical protein
MSFFVPIVVRPVDHICTSSERVRQSFGAVLRFSELFAVRPFSVSGCAVNWARSSALPSHCRNPQPYWTTSMSTQSSQTASTSGALADSP